MPGNEIETWAGLRVITSPWMTVPELVPRSWRERLFSWPWRPWVRVKQVMISDGRILQMENTLLMHPQTLERLRDAARSLERIG